MLNLVIYAIFDSFHAKKYQLSKSAKFLGGKSAYELFFLCKISTVLHRVSSTSGSNFGWGSYILFCHFNVQSCFFCSTIEKWNPYPNGTKKCKHWFAYYFRSGERGGSLVVILETSLLSWGGGQLRWDVATLGLMGWRGWGGGFIPFGSSQTTHSRGSPLSPGRGSRDFYIGVQVWLSTFKLVTFLEPSLPWTKVVLVLNLVIPCKGPLR